MFILPIDEEIHLKLLLPKDAEYLVSVLRNNQEHLKKWLMWAVKLPSIETYKEKIIPSWLRKFADNNGFEVGIYYKGDLVGMIGLHYIDWRNKTTEIGYWISQSYQGKGIMTRTVESLTHYCFNELDLNRITIRSVTENEKSCAIPIRLGYSQEGFSREAIFLHGKYYDLVNYSKLQKDV